jgi:hypothetical protein
VPSAKYGFNLPEFLISGPYVVSFEDSATGPIAVERLRDQVCEQRLDRYPVVVGLGGKDYRAAVEAAFADVPVRLVFPFAGLPFPSPAVMVLQLDR